MSNSVKIIQLTTPAERFKKFNTVADRVLTLMDELGEHYIDLGFRESDIEGYSVKEEDELREEIKHHGQLVFSLLDHPIISVLRDNRNSATSDEVKTLYPIPSGVWQHYKGAKYRILEVVTSTDFRRPAIVYQLDNDEDSTKYTMVISNFFKKVKYNRELVSRFTKV